MHTHTQWFNSHFAIVTSSHSFSSYTCSEPVSALERPELFITSSTPSHYVFLGHPLSYFLQPHGGTEMRISLLHYYYYYRMLDIISTIVFTVNKSNLPELDTLSIFSKLNLSHALKTLKYWQDILRHPHNHSYLHKRSWSDISTNMQRRGIVGYYLA